MGILTGCRVLSEGGRGGGASGRSMSCLDDIQGSQRTNERPTTSSIVIPPKANNIIYYDDGYLMIGSAGMVGRC